MGAGLEDLYEEFRAHPLAMGLHLGTVFVICVMVLGVLVALASGAPTRQEDLWLGVIGLGTVVVLTWTVLVPILDRLQEEADQDIPVE